MKNVWIPSFVIAWLAARFFFISWKTIVVQGNLCVVEVKRQLMKIYENGNDDDEARVRIKIKIMEIFMSLIQDFFIIKSGIKTGRFALKIANVLL